MEGDSWAQVPVLEPGLLVSAEMKGRITADGSMLSMRRTGPRLSVETKRCIYRGWWRAPHVADLSAAFGRDEEAHLPRAVAAAFLDGLVLTPI
jgi:hypothetical protein